MKNTIKIAFALVFCLMLGVAANAQAITSGTVDFTVTVPEAFDLRSNGSVVIGLAGGITDGTPTIANAQLGALLIVGDASPNTNNATLTASVPIRMRSNRGYKLQAARNNNDGLSAQNFDSTDIGMTLTVSRPASAQVNTGGSDTVVPIPGNNVGGLAPGITGGTTILTGDRISNQGDNNSTDNFATASLDFSIARQYYTPTAGIPYQQKVTVSISANP